MNNRFLYSMGLLSMICATASLHATLNTSIADARNTSLSSEALMSSPYYYKRLINILSAGLDNCKLIGTDKIAFVTDINSVMQSPINDRSSLEKVRFLTVIRRAKTHDAFINNAKAQINFIEIENYLKDLIIRQDYFNAVDELLHSKKMTRDRSDEIMRYLTYVVYDEDLNKDDKNFLRELIVKAMDIMPAYKDDLQRLLDYLNREPEGPQVVERVVKEAAEPEVIERVVYRDRYIEKPGKERIIYEEAPERKIAFEGTSGAASRRSGTVTLRRQRDQGPDRAERLRERQAHEMDRERYERQ